MRPIRDDLPYIRNVFYDTLEGQFNAGYPELRINATVYKRFKDAERAHASRMKEKVGWLRLGFESGRRSLTVSIPGKFTTEGLGPNEGFLEVNTRQFVLTGDREADEMLLWFYASQLLEAGDERPAVSSFNPEGQL